MLDLVRFAYVFILRDSQHFFNVWDFRNLQDSTIFQDSTTFNSVFYQKWWKGPIVFYPRTIPNYSSKSPSCFKKMLDLMVLLILTISGFKRFIKIPAPCFFRFYSKRSRLKIVLDPPTNKFQCWFPGLSIVFKFWISKMLRYAKVIYV